MTPAGTAACLAILAAFAFSQPAAEPSLTRAAEFIRRQKPQEAETLLRRIVKTEPGNTGAWNLLGAALDAESKCRPAEEAFQKAAQLAPALAGIWNNLGNHYLACGDPGKARETFRKVLALEPAHSNANLQLARLALDQKEGAEALKRLDRLSGDELALPAVILLRARALSFAGRKADALVLLDRLEKQAGGPAAWHTLGLALAECGEFARAEALFSRALEADPANPEILRNLGLAALRANHSRAVEFLRQALALDPSPGARLDLVTAISKTSGPQPAMQELDKTPAQERKGDYYLLKAELLDTMGQVKEAGESLNLALARESTRPDLYRSAILFFLEHGMDWSATSLLENAAKVGRGDRDLQLLQAVVVARSSRFEESRLLLEQISRRWPEWSRPYLLRGIVEQNQYRNEEALRSIQTAMNLGEHGPEACYYLGLALLGVEPPQWMRALEAARKAMEMSPDDPWAKILAGRISKQAGQYDAALGYFKEAARIEPGLAQAHYWLGSTFLAMGKTEEGRHEMAEVDRLRERNPAKVNSEDGGLREKLFALSQ